jgi:hypothetical protein
VKSKIQKRTEALERQEFWRGLTPEAQLAALIRRGAGYCKQAHRLCEKTDHCGEGVTRH